MKRAMTMIAFCGLGSAATAQSLSVTLSFDVSLIGFGESATATLSASFTGQPAGAYLSSVNIDLIATLPWTVSNVAAVAWNNVALGFDGQGVASGGDVLGIEAAQFSLIPPITAGSPILITTFTVTSTTEGVLTYDAQAANGAPFLFSVTGGGFADPVVEYGAEVFSSGSLSVIPAPGGVGLGVMCLAAATRRRRTM